MPVVAVTNTDSSDVGLPAYGLTIPSGQTVEADLSDEQAAEVAANPNLHVGAPGEAGPTVVSAPAAVASSDSPTAEEPAPAAEEVSA